MTTQTATTTVQPQTVMQDRMGTRVYVIREANTPGYWDVRYPDGYVYTVHEAELRPADD